MQVTIEKKLDKKINEASRTFGVDRRHIVERALIFYLDSVKKASDLRNELYAWEKLSDESFVNIDYAKR